MISINSDNLSYFLVKQTNESYVTYNFSMKQYVLDWIYVPFSSRKCFPP